MYMNDVAKYLLTTSYWNRIIALYATQMELSLVEARWSMSLIIWIQLRMAHWIPVRENCYMYNVWNIVPILYIDVVKAFDQA